MRDVIAIETKRLKLRGLRMSDATRIARFCGDPAVGRNLAMTPLPYLETAAEGWIMTLAARRRLAREFVYGVDLPGDGLAHRFRRPRHFVVERVEDVQLGALGARYKQRRKIAVEVHRADEFIPRVLDLGHSSRRKAAPSRSGLFL